MAERQQEVTQEIHDYLSAQGKKGGKIGGQRVKELIEAGKEALGETEETDLEEGEDQDETYQ